MTGFQTLDQCGAFRDDLLHQYGWFPAALDDVDGRVWRVESESSVAALEEFLIFSPSRRVLRDFSNIRRGALE